MKEQYIIYLDTGGTFSDAIILKSDGSFVTGKSSTTPEDLSICFIKCIEAACEKLGQPLDEILTKTVILGFGTTAGTNAIITRVGGPKLGLICTRGFEDTTIHMKAAGRWDGMGMEEAMHIAGGDNPRPLIPRSLIKGVTERIDSSGAVVFPLYEEEVEKAVDELMAEGVDGIAVTTLWSFLNNVHEKRIKEIIHKRTPDMPVALSCEIAPTVREYSRSNSTILNLYIEKPLRILFSKIKKILAEKNYTKPLLVMQAAGGLSRSSVVQPISTLHSGPIGGLMGVHFFQKLYGIKNIGGSDVGGTSFDICILPEQGPHFIKEPIVNQFRLKNPMMQVESIGAGGGTIAYLDEVTGRLRVGPHSAGSEPGPVCYQRGGTEPTVTDADVVMNRIDPDYFLGGKMTLDRDTAYAAMKEKIADPLGMTPEEAAEAICTIADNRMGAILGRMIRERGLEPDEFVLFAFGGAGPAHCVGYSYLSGLNFQKVMVSPYASTFSAFGASTANVLHRYETTPYLVMPKIPFDRAKRTFKLESLDTLPSGVVERFNQAFENLEKRAFNDMAEEGFARDEVAVRSIMEVRYGGQLWEGIFNSPVRKITSVEDMNAIIKSFEEEYERRYTKLAMYPDGGLEVISLALEVSAETPKPNFIKRPFKGESPDSALKGSRNVYFRGEFLESKVYEMVELEHGNVVTGPAIVEGTDTTLVLPNGFGLVVDEYLNLAITRVR